MLSAHTIDHDVQGLALARIRRRARGPQEWKHTFIGELHPGIAHRLTLPAGELPIACGFMGDNSWWLVTTRRITSQHAGQQCTLDPRSDSITATFGHDPKGTAHDFGTAAAGITPATDLATVTAADGRQLRLEFETGPACMVPIQACHFWQSATGLHRP